MLSLRILPTGLRAAKHVRCLSTSHPDHKVFGQVVSWGTNGDGQLGLQRNEKNVAEPAQVEALHAHPVTKLAAGLDFSAAVTDNGDLFTWGTNKFCQLGHDDEEAKNVPTLVEALKGVKIVDVALGDYHGACLDDTGAVYTWGFGGSFWSGCGGLGQGNSDTYGFPTKVEAFPSDVKISKIACGGQHTVALAENGDVYSWGKGEHGRLGNGGTSDAKVPQVMDTFPSSVQVTDIDCGEAYGFFVTADGKGFSVGRNTNGELGHGVEIGTGPYSVARIPQHIVQLEDVKTMACGSSHGMALDNSGRVYQWGARSWFEPRVVSELQEKISQIAAGTTFSAAISDQGYLFTWGKGRNGQLGLPNKKNVDTPTKVPSLENHVVLEIACGRHHSLALVKER